MFARFVRVTLVSLCGALFASHVFAQVSLGWAQTHTGTTPDGGDIFVKVLSDSLGNSYAVGTVFNGTFPNDYADIVIVKYNTAGVVQWTRTYDRNGFDDVAFDATIDSAGSVYVTGYSSLDANSQNTDVLILKVTTSNVLSFATTYIPTSNDLDEWAYSIVVDSGGNAYIGGEAGATGALSPYDGALFRVNSSGVFQWRRVYSGSAGDYDVIDNLVLASNGDVFAGGTLQNTNTDAIIARVTSANVQSWSNTFSSATTLSVDQTMAIARDGSDNVYLLGRTYKSNTPSDRQESFLRKYNGAGTLQWTNIYDGNATGITVPWDVAVDTGGICYVVGETSVGGLNESNYDQFIQRVNSSGVQTHVVTRNAGFGDFFRRVGLNNLGNPVVCGWSDLDANVPQTNIDGVLISYAASNLAQQWVTTYNGAGNDWDRWLDMSVSGSTYYVCGFTYATFFDANCLVAKYTSGTSAFITPASFQILAGQLLGGNLASLASSDNNKFILLMDEFDSNSTVEFTAASPTSIPVMIKLHAEASASRNDLGAYSEAFNYNSNSWVQLDFRLLPITDVVYTPSFPGTLANYIGPSNAIKTRHRTIPTGDIDAADGWSVSLDRWQWEIQ